MFFSRSKGIVSLDIGSSAVKLVELKEREGGDFQLVRLGVEAFSPEAIVDGSIMDSSLVVDAIHKLSAEVGVKNDNFGTSLSGHSVIIKKIQLPAMSPEELSESIQWEAEQYIPFDINDVRLDYVVLEDEGSSMDDNMDVLLVAVKRDKVNDYVSVIGQAGKTPALVDVDSFAVQNAYEANYDLSFSAIVELAEEIQKTFSFSFLGDPANLIDKVDKVPEILGECDIAIATASKEFLPSKNRRYALADFRGHADYLKIVITDGAKPQGRHVGVPFIRNKATNGRRAQFFARHLPHFRTRGVASGLKPPEGNEIVTPRDNVNLEVTLSAPVAIGNSARFAIREGGRFVGGRRFTRIREREFNLSYDQVNDSWENSQKATNFINVVSRTNKRHEIG